MKLLIIQVSPVSCYFLHLTSNYLPQYPILEHPHMTFQMLHFTFSRIHVKSTRTLLHCTPPTKKRVLTHCKLCLKPLNCTITLSVKRINIYIETAIHCSHMCHFLQMLLISLSPNHPYKAMHNYIRCIIPQNVHSPHQSFSLSRIVCPNPQYS